MPTPLGDKLGASMINVSLMVGASVPLYFIMPEVNSWRLACVLTFLIYNLLFRKRCLGMRLMDTYIEPPSSIPYVAAYAVGFASIIYWVWLPFDLLLLNSAAQLTSILRTGNTLHGWITRNTTMTRDERVQRAKTEAFGYLERGELVQAVASISADMAKIDGRHRPDLTLLGLCVVQDRDPDQVRHFIEGFN